MAGSKYFKKVKKELISHGFEFAHRNSSANWVFTRDRQEIVINPSCDENAARQIIQRLKKDNGTKEAATKRNASAIKERQAHDRERLKAEADRLEAERTEILLKRNEQLSGLGEVLSAAEVRELTDRLEVIDREHLAIKKLMESPVVSAHLGAGRVQHQAGSR